jgi:hypothetical protein
MKTTDILTLLDAEIATLKQARALITGTESAPVRKPGRPKSAAATAVVPTAKRKKRNLTPEGRARIAEAVKRRWAAAKKAAK